MEANLPWYSIGTPEHAQKRDQPDTYMVLTRKLFSVILRYFVPCYARHSFESFDENREIVVEAIGRRRD